MSPNNPSILYLGLDVAKASLQLDLAGQPQSLANDAKGHAQLLKLLRPHPAAHVVCEATGGYEQPAVRVLHAAQIPVSIVEAGRVRHFAKAKGLRAKTDPIDAAALSEYGRRLQPAATAAPTPQQAQLAELSTRRQQLLTTLTAESNRAAHYVDKLCLRQARQLRQALEKQIAACDQAIAQLIAADEVLQAKAERLDAIAGVGAVIAATVLAELPELGQLSDAAAAALAGVAPFADLVWKPIVLIEMKKRGADLQKHFQQAFDYWTRLTGGRPRYVVLCNFDEFWIYDFDSDLDAPKDKLALTDLPERWGPLAFLAPGSPAPKFLYDREAVTRQAADQLATLFTSLLQRGVERPLAQRFTLQMLIALFAEDIDLLPRYFVAGLLEECTTAADTYDLLGGLFEAMNRTPPVSGGRYKGVRYFNGGLFAEAARVELTDRELVLLREAAQHDWSKVQPEIFGTLFEHSVSDPDAAVDERRAFGMHFTRPTDIMKIVKPTILEPWTEQIEGAKTLARLHQLLDRLHRFRVLDPACGSGNFLYLAYRALKRLEARLYDRIDTEFASRAEPGQVRLSFLSAQNFFGLDINPLAVEIAKVAMIVARKLAIDELHIAENPLPLDNLDQNFRATDALLTPDGQPAQWPPADVIIGNPPFVDARRLTMTHGRDYVTKLEQLYPQVPRRADFCTYWFRKAHDHLPPCTAADPVAGRAGLVGTQNIRNNESREGGLDYVATTGTIVEAVENQPWSGEANVHVSIANWVKTQVAALLPKTRKLWFKVEPAASAKKLRKRGTGPASKQYDLDFRECDFINSALSNQTDVVSAKALECNRRPKRCFEGQQPGHEGFRLTAAERAKLLSQENAAAVVFPYVNGTDLLTDGLAHDPTFIIDFGTRNMLEASAFPKTLNIVRERVLADWQKDAAAE